MASFNCKVKIDMWTQKIWLNIILFNKKSSDAFKNKVHWDFFMDFWKSLIFYYQVLLTHFSFKTSYFYTDFSPSICLAMCTFGVAIFFTSKIRKCTLDA